MGYNLNNDVPLGQLGSAYLADDSAFTPPTGRVIIAITMVDETSFSILAPELPTDSTFKGSSTGGNSDINCIGTVAPVDSNGTNADAVGGSDVFPKGLTIYGRWKTVQLNNDVGAPTTCVVILYFGI